jgi:hypothetical protein
MNGEKTHWTAIGLVISSLATIAFGAIALTGFSAGTGGDLAITSTPWLSNLLLAGGAVLLLGLELARSRRRRPVAVRRSMAAVGPVDGIAA